jgi:hypothetical protein
MAKFMKIMIEIDTGKVTVTDENDVPAKTGDSPYKRGGITKEETWTVVHTQSSPGCQWILTSAGWQFVCSP